MELYFFIIVLVFVVFGFTLTLYVRFFRRVHFSDPELTQLTARLSVLYDRARWDPRHVILECDKLVDLLLARRGYRGTLGEKLKTFPRYVSCRGSLWKLHILRNRLAHELDVEVSPRDALFSLRTVIACYRDSGVSFSLPFSP